MSDADAAQGTEPVADESVDRPESASGVTPGDLRRPTADKSDNASGELPELLADLDTVELQEHPARFQRVLEDLTARLEDESEPSGGPAHVDESAHADSPGQSDGPGQSDDPAEEPTHEAGPAQPDAGTDHDA